MMNTDQIRRRVAELGQWFHNLDLGGVKTAPDHFLGDYPSVKWERFSKALPENLKGKTVLDVGCNGGFYSIKMKQRGASQVVGIDTDEKYLEQARFAAEVSRAFVCGSWASWRSAVWRGSLIQLRIRLRSWPR